MPWDTWVCHGIYGYVLAHTGMCQNIPVYPTPLLICPGTYRFIIGYTGISRKESDRAAERLPGVRRERYDANASCRKEIHCVIDDVTLTIVHQ
jgi:hypothetical protein